MKNPSVAAFVAWSIFRKLSQEFDDNQAAPTKLIDPFSKLLLPRLIQWTASDVAFNSPDEATESVNVLHDCLKVIAQP